MARPQQLQSDRGNPRLKFLDRYVGIPIVGVLGVVRRLRGRRTIPTEWHTLGLFLTAGIGDTVVATGIFRDLRAAFPDARIVLFVTANNASFARRLTAPDAIVELPVRQIPTAVRAVRAERCDIILDLSAWRRFDAVLAAFSGAKVTIGLRTKGQHRHFAHDIVVEHRTDHEIENDRNLVATLGVRSTSEPSIDPPTGLATPFAAPYVAMHLWPGGANFEERSWPLPSWMALARSLNERGLDVVLTGGPGDVEVSEQLVGKWREAGIRVHQAAGGSWPESLAILSGATGLISVNTGVMHVGAALGTPTLALNGPTSGRRWGPRGAHVACVASPMIPEGYLNLGFERDERYRDCMSVITVEMVLAAWDELLAEAQGAQD